MVLSFDVRVDLALGSILIRTVLVDLVLVDLVSYNLFCKFRMRLVVPSLACLQD